MRVSVVMCTYDPAIENHLRAAVESLFAQTYDDIELILVVDGDAELCERAIETYEFHDECVVICNATNRGISASRNRGLGVATGEVIAFMDDDAVADPDWITELVRTYTETDAIAVGGRMTPIWLTRRPRMLPDEFLWLVGVNDRGFAEPGAEIRNTFGSNLSVKREVLAELGGFEPSVGTHHRRSLQAEEAELGSRLRASFGRGVRYNPDARVGHKVFPHRTELTWLLARCFWQGYSKALVTHRGPATGKPERAFLRRLLRESTPRRGKQLVRSPSINTTLELAAIVLFTAAVGAGYTAAIALEWIGSVSRQ